MNVGYANAKTFNNVDMNCPICGADIYISKYGNDFKCMNEKCPVSENASNVIMKLQNFMNNKL